MLDTSGGPWSSNPNAPNITSFEYLAEKSNFAGIIISAILYGIDVVLFFLCMMALIGPIDRPRGGVRWGLVVHTVAMFLCATIYTAATLDTQSISYVDDRGFPGVDGWPPGSLGYQFFVYSEPITVVPSVMFALNQLLADGLLLYRCYVIYSMNLWVVAFPCLMYIASLGFSVTAAYYQVSDQYTKSINFGIPYFSVSLSLNILLTIMIVLRLVLRGRSVREVMGPIQNIRPNKFYKAIITIVVESCALYSISSVLNIGPWCTNNPVQFAFFPILVQSQVIAPFLVILRVANQRESANGDVSVSSIQFRNQGESTDGSETLPGGNPMSSVGTRDETRGNVSLGAETMIGSH